MTLRTKNFILAISIIILASSCGSASQENPNSLPTDSTTIFNDSTAAA